MDSNENDISWLTQEASVDSQLPNFATEGSYIEEDLVGKCSYGVVSMEDNANNLSLLYNGVYVEDISSDECIDAM